MPRISAYPEYGHFVSAVKRNGRRASVFAAFQVEHGYVGRKFYVKAFNPIGNRALRSSRRKTSARYPLRIRGERVQRSIATAYAAAVRRAKRDYGLARKIVAFQKGRYYSRRLTVPYRIAQKDHVVLFHVFYASAYCGTSGRIGLLFIRSAVRVILQIVGGVRRFGNYFVKRAVCFAFDMLCYAFRRARAGKIGYEHFISVSCRRYRFAAVSARRKSE